MTDQVERRLQAEAPPGEIIGGHEQLIARRKRCCEKTTWTLEEAYELRDASATPEEQDFFQQLVYRLRAEEYRSRNINTAESVRRRERSRNEARRAHDGSASRSWWERVFAGQK